MAGTVITIMATIITDLTTIHIIIIIIIIITIIIIQTDLLPHPIQTGGIQAIILNLPHVIIIHQEGQSTSIHHELLTQENEANRSHTSYDQEKLTHPPIIHGIG